MSLEQHIQLQPSGAAAADEAFRRDTKQVQEARERERLRSLLNEAREQLQLERQAKAVAEAWAVEEARQRQQAVEQLARAQQARSDDAERLYMALDEESEIRRITEAAAQTEAIDKDRAQQQLAVALAQIRQLEADVTLSQSTGSAALTRVQATAMMQLRAGSVRSISSVLGAKSHLGLFGSKVRCVRGWQSKVQYNKLALMTEMIRRARQQETAQQETIEQLQAANQQLNSAAQSAVQSLACQFTQQAASEAEWTGGCIEEPAASEHVTDQLHKATEQLGEILQWGREQQVDAHSQLMAAEQRVADLRHELTQEQEARHEVLDRMREELGTKQLDVERSRGQFEQQESLVEQLRQVLAEEKSVQQLMDAELTRAQSDHSQVVAQLGAELDLERREREAREELVDQVRQQMEVQAKEAASIKQQLDTEQLQVRDLQEQLQQMSEQTAQCEQTLGEERSGRGAAEGKCADQLRQLEESLLAQQALLQDREQDSHTSGALQQEMDQLVAQLQQAQAAAALEKTKLAEEVELRLAAEAQCANQLRQLKTSLSQHQDLLDGREQESHHFALACEEAAATKAALDAERAHSASLQEDVRKLAGELAIEESALVKQTAKREAAETKWEEEWCDKVAAREATELLQSELNMQTHQYQASQAQCDKLTVEHRRALTDLLEVQTVAKHLASCEGTDTENTRLHLMLKTAEHEMEALRAQISHLQDGGVAQRSQRASTLTRANLLKS